MILITGCTGYIGSRLAKRLLSKGIKVRGLVMPEEMDKIEELLEYGMEAFKGNLLNPETIKGIGKDIEFVFHMAGLHSSVGRMTSLYIDGTKALINELENSTVKRFYHAGNGSVYGDCGDSLLFETDITNPAHPFGVISLKTEKIVMELSVKKQFQCIILRISEVYGPEKYNPFKDSIYHKLKIPGNGMNYTSKIHIDDLIEILLLVLNKTKVNKIYNICDDLPVIQKEFYQEINRISGGVSPEWMVYETLPDRIKLSIHGLRMMSLRMSNKNMKADLNYKFKYSTIKEGLTDLYNLANISPTF